MKQFLIYIFLLFACAACWGQQTDKISVFSTWDDDMLYLAVSAQGPDIRAVHKDFNKPIETDDGIEIFLNLSDDMKSDVYSDKTSYIAVSAAGGFEFRRGNGKELLQQNLFSHRYGVDVQGNLNDSSNIDSGYSIEVALPWSAIGGENMSYKALGINFKVTVCGKSYYLTDEQSFLKPDKCWSLLLSKVAAFSTKGSNKIISNHYMTEPRINGEIKENEWFSRSAYTIEIPVDGDNPYELVFADQPVKPVLFDPNAGNNGFFDDPKRAGYLRDVITELGGDVLVIPASNPYLPQIFEALSEQLAEGRTASLVSPLADGEPEALFDFYRLLPEQLRRTAVDSDGNIGFPVYTDNPDENTADEFEKEFGKKIIYRSLDNLNAESELKRNKKAYSYVITGINVPALNSAVARQMSVFIKNTGTLTWKSGEAALQYRWYVNGRFYSNGIALIPIMNDVAPGSVYQLDTVIAPINEKRKPIPEGEVICELDIINTVDGQSMSKPERETFFFKVLIEAPAVYVNANAKETKKALLEAKENAPLPYVVNANEPCIIAPQGTYRDILRIMNTTCEAWEPEKTYIEAEICLFDASGNVLKRFGKTRLELRENTPDGNIGTFDGLLETGKMQVTVPGAAEYYALCYTLIDKKTKIPVRSRKILNAQNDDNQRIIAVKMPEKSEETGKYQLMLAVRNAGIRKWPCADTYLALSWYDLNGNCVKKDFYKALLRAPQKKVKVIEPGDTIQTTVEFDAFPGDGEWYLVAELYDKDTLFGNGVLEKINDKQILKLTAD